MPVPLKNVRGPHAQRGAFADYRRYSPFLTESFENLVRNAVEHGGEGVTVTLGKLTERAGLYFEDDGPGIPPGERDEVFEAGYSTVHSGTDSG
jgi:signal transduction histidine kinase